MFLPRTQIAQLYLELVQSTHPLSPPVLILTALTVDALCATRILTALLKRDYIPHKVQPISGYADLARAGQELVLPLTRQRGGTGGLVVCLGAGGLVDLEEVLGLDGNDADGQPAQDMENHGVDVWVLDARRQWNLQNIFGTGTQSQADAVTRSRPGVDQGKLLSTYRAGRGGIIVWDDGDIDTDLSKEKEAFMALLDMPEITEDDLIAGNLEDADVEDADVGSTPRRKRKASSDDDEDSLHGSDEERPYQRRRSNSGTPIPSSPGGNPRSAQVSFSSSQAITRDQSPSVVVPSSPPREPSNKELRQRLLRLRRKHEATIDAYYTLGTSFSEPVSSILYSLASELGREDNDLLWVAIVGITSVDLSPYANATSSGSRTERKKIMNRAEQRREVLRDEVRRLNPVSAAEMNTSQSQNDVIPTNARSPTDTGIRLSPEPRFLLIRHWSLRESMLHSTNLATRLHIWSESGRKRLNKLLAKMGISLNEADKGYAHMDMEIKRSLRQRILRFAEQYNLDGLVPGDDGRTGKEGWGFVRSWGWKATLSAADVSNIAGSILEIGTDAPPFLDTRSHPGQSSTYNSRMRALPTPPHSSDDGNTEPVSSESPDWTTSRFFAAYDSLNPSTTSSSQGISVLLQHISTAQHLSRAILRTGSALMSKKQIRHLRAFRMGVVKEGPDVATFTHPGALVKLAAWVAEAIAVVEAEKGRRHSNTAQQEALVLGCLDEARGVYVVVGLGGGGSSGRRPKSKAEIKAREEKKKRRDADRAAKKAERARKREERRQIRRDILAANGEDTDQEDDSDATESEASDDDDGSDGESDASESGDEDSREASRRRGYGLNRFGQAFQEVVAETAARVRIDSFEHSVVEVRKEDLAGFLEALSLKSVMG